MRIIPIAMEHEPGLFERRDPQAEAASLARARADIAAGRGVDHAVVRQWLLTWGKPGRVSFEDWLAAQNG